MAARLAPTTLERGEGWGRASCTTQRDNLPVDVPWVDSRYPSGLINSVSFVGGRGTFCRDEDD
jgi:hypothetical protein